MITQNKIITKNGDLYKIVQKISDDETGEVRVEIIGTFSLSDIQNKIVCLQAQKDDWQDTLTLAEAM
jgi:hypothetical protein